MIGPARGRRRHRAGRAAGVLLFAVAALWIAAALATLPPARTGPPGGAIGHRKSFELAGAFHVHTTRSDGADTPEEVARAAEEAGLRFVVTTDHGDATRTPSPPRYVGDVLVLDAVEISTDGGHYIALGMGPSPYPLGGAPRDVVEDVRRLGGFGIAAHPHSAKPELAWRGWDTEFDGLEWLNADSEWRDDGGGRLLALPVQYLLRSPETLASLFSRPARTLARWDRETRHRTVVGLAGHDAHGRLGLRGGTEPYHDAVALPVPSYVSVFRTFTIRVLVPREPSCDAAADASMLVEAIRDGRVYTVIDAVGAPGTLEFYAEADRTTRVEMGGRIPRASSIRLIARTPLPDAGRIVISRAGLAVAASATGEAIAEVDGTPAAYRVEVHRPDAPGSPPIPWMVTNPIYVGPPPPTGAVSETARFGTVTELPLDPSAWSVEKETASRGAMRAESRALTFEWQLSSAASPYAAIAMPIEPAEPLEGVRITASAARPMRVSVQLRAPEGRDGWRWRRSIYLDTNSRTINIPVDEFERVGDAPERPRPDRLTALLLVVDLEHARRGSSGRFTIERIGLAR